MENGVGTKSWIFVGICRWASVEMLFAHLKRILGLGQLRLRGPCSANDEFLLAATAQNLRKLAKIFPAPQQLRKA
jgi:DDE family transposase